MPFKYPSMEERILANSIESRDQQYAGSFCWIWIGRTKPNASGTKYGVITRRYKRGPREGKVRTDYVHRVVIQVFKGRRMTPKMVGLHLCNNTLCCNPEHLKGGTQVANMRQMVKDGRARNGRTK